MFHLFVGKTEEQVVEVARLLRDSGKLAVLHTDIRREVEEVLSKVVSRVETTEHREDEPEEEEPTGDEVAEPEDSEDDKSEEETGSGEEEAKDPEKELVLKVCEDYEDSNFNKIENGFSLPWFIYNLILECMANDNLKYTLNGFLYEKKPGNHIANVVAIDGRRLVRYQTSAKLEGSFIISAKSKAKKNKGDVVFVTEDNGKSFTMNQSKESGKLERLEVLSGKFPNFEMFIPAVDDLKGGSGPTKIALNFDLFPSNWRGHLKLRGATVPVVVDHLTHSGTDRLVSTLMMVVMPMKIQN